MTDQPTPDAVIQLDLALSADDEALIRKAAPFIRAAERQRIVAWLRRQGDPTYDWAADLIESERSHE